MRMFHLKLVVSRVDKVDSPTGYKLVGVGTVCGGVWDGTSGVKGGEVEGSEVEEGGIEPSEVDMVRWAILR